MQHHATCMALAVDSVVEVITTLRRVMLQVARVWDALFSEGSKILFRTALAVLKAQEDILLAINNAGEAVTQELVVAPGVMLKGTKLDTCTCRGVGLQQPVHQLYQQHHPRGAKCAASCAGELLMAVRQYTSNLHDRDKLMTVAFEGIGSMPMAVIERCRHERR